MPVVNTEIIENIRFVLIDTTHPGNIGATARALKTMGLQHLFLVAPKLFPHADCTVRAAGADDILAQAVVTDTVSQAIADCGLVIGTSARMRSLSWPLLDSRQCADKIITTASSATKVAVLFGQERIGLTNEQLQLCHYHVQIPANPQFCSLNLAAAVQIISYELRMALSSSTPTSTSVTATEAQLAKSVTATQAQLSNEAPSSAKALQLFYQQLEQTLIDIDFLQPQQPRQLMRRLRRLINRAYPDQQELNILRGILTAMNKMILKCKTSKS